MPKHLMAKLNISETPSYMSSLHAIVLFEQYCRITAICWNILLFHLHLERGIVKCEYYGGSRGLVWTKLFRSTKDFKSNSLSTHSSYILNETVSEHQSPSWQMALRYAPLFPSAIGPISRFLKNHEKGIIKHIIINHTLYYDYITLNLFHIYLANIWKFCK